jgi:hypothetical protein
MSSGGRAPECRGIRFERACSIGLLILSCGLLLYIEVVYFCLQNVQKVSSLLKLHAILAFSLKAPPKASLQSDVLPLNPQSKCANLRAHGNRKTTTSYHLTSAHSFSSAHNKKTPWLLAD